MTFEVAEDERVEHRIEIAGLADRVAADGEDAMVAMGSYRGAQSAVLNLLAGGIMEEHQSGI
ncbi:hypothetical protein [Brevibacterium litoralis]|uniref:hypothetical protein n=1 Tax=Brevibacterium litoralis TaxID=3138935 RepID=UPI0032EDCC67